MVFLSPFRPSSAPALVCAAVAAVALASALVGPVQAQPAPPADGKHGGAHPAMAHRMGPGMGGGMMLSDRVLDSVGASADQKARIKDILGRAREDMRQQHQADQSLHTRMMAILAAPQIDAAAAEDVRRQMQARRDEGSRRHLQALLDAGAVLTPEQRQALAERGRSHREMHERHRRERESAAPRS